MVGDLRAALGKRFDRLQGQPGIRGRGSIAIEGAENSELATTRTDRGAEGALKRRAAPARWPGPIPAMRPILLLLVASSLAPLSGCCSLARFFCGPDRSEWVSERYDTPRQAVQTLFEAIRRDDAEVVYLSLARSCRQRLGLDGLTTKIAWQRLREKVPGLHVAGYAEIPEPTLHGKDRASVAVAVEGYVVEVDLERQAYQEIRYRRADGNEAAQSEVIGSLGERARIELAPPLDRWRPWLEDEGEAHSLVHLAPVPFHRPLDADVDMDAVEHIALTHRWKVADLRMRE